jgi:hypothetical protein
MLENWWDKQVNIAKAACAETKDKSEDKLA